MPILPPNQQCQRTEGNSTALDDTSLQLYHAGDVLVMLIIQRQHVGQAECVLTLRRLPLLQPTSPHHQLQRT